MLMPLWFAVAALVPAGAGQTLQPERSTAPIVVVWPPEGMAMPLSNGEFILGSVSDPAASFSINGQTVSVHHNGAFLAWLPITPGTFTFNCSLKLKDGPVSSARNIIVTAPEPPLAEKPPAIDAESIWPKSDMELRAGDFLAFEMRASPGQKAQCRLGKRPWQDLREAAAGLYDALQAVEPGASGKAAAVECRLKSGWSSIQSLSRGRVTLCAGPPAVGIVKNNAALRTGPGNGYMAFPTPGTRLALAGRAGGEYKVSLGPTLDAFIDAKDVELLPAGTPAPRAVTGTIHTAASDHATQVHIGLSERVAFSVDENDELSSLTLRLFNCAGHTNWIVYDSNDRFVEEVRWRQEAGGVVAITIRLNPRMTLWGWQASYEGSSLRLKLRRAPELAPAPASALKGLTVVLDPGHMPSAMGATGPLGTREMDVNFAIAESAAAALARRGAIPVLTRATTDQEVSLTDRPRLAVEKKGDLFLSIHNNALPEGENPFSRPRGFSVFYYHPHSLSLARELYRSYSERVPLPGEQLRYGNLLVARLSAMPAVIIENAYLMLPSQEEKLNDPAFRKTLGEAMAAGLESFLEAQRAKQGPQPRARPLESGGRPDRQGHARSRSQPRQNARGSRLLKETPVDKKGRRSRRQKP